MQRFFAQYRDRTQVDLSVGFAPIVNLPRTVVLYDREGAVHIVGDDAIDPEADEARVCACPAWEALANVGKSVRRPSYWETLDQLMKLPSIGFTLGTRRAGTPGLLWDYGPRRLGGEDAA